MPVESVYLLFDIHPIPNLSAMADSALQAFKPMSVREIAGKAQDFEFDPHIALKYWFRTADALVKEAQIYEGENNDQQAYLLYMRFATLVVDKLSTHPEAQEPENVQTLKEIKKSVFGVVLRLEDLKPRINRRYEAWQKAEGRRPVNSIATPTYKQSFAASDPAIAGNRATVAGADHPDLAVKVATKEIQRRDAARRATRQAGISEEQEQARRTAGLWDDWEVELSRHKPSNQDDEDIRIRMQEAREAIDGSQDSTPDLTPDHVRQRTSRIDQRRSGVRASSVRASNNWSYPQVARSQPIQYEQHEQTQLNGAIQPPKPPKVAIHAEWPLPQRPEKQPLEDGASTTSSPVTPGDEVSAETFTFSPSAYLENGTPLRTVFLPPDLRTTFLTYAAANTRANLETCGILCGTLISNALFISHLVIPDQESTSDTCDTVNEGELFDFCDKADLMVLGWIHTHPSQTCFMSSRDLHTHSGYQVMMPEAIAIVCAPSKNPSWGVFRLTNPPGLKSILDCRQTGLFHPHAEHNIYTGALRPGHVSEARGLKFTTVDLRPDKTRR